MLCVWKIYFQFESRIRQFGNLHHFPKNLFTSLFTLDACKLWLIDGEKTEDSIYN